MAKKTDGNGKGLGLSSLNLAESRVVDILTPSGQSVGVRITLAGPYHDAVQAHDRKTRSQVQQMLRNFGNPRKMTRAQREELDELSQAQANERIVASVLGWDSDDYPGATPGIGGKVEYPAGTVRECTPKDVAELLKALPYLKDQLASEMLDEVGFTRQ